jgi:hypothetical protein
MIVVEPMPVHPAAVPDSRKFSGLRRECHSALSECNQRNQGQWRGRNPAALPHRLARRFRRKAALEL